MADDPATAGLAVDVVSWQEEEGTYMTCFGSRSWCGSLEPAVEMESRNPGLGRSEEHKSELQSLMRSKYAVFALKNKTANIDRLLLAITNIRLHRSTNIN